MTEKVELNKEQLKQLIQMFFDATNLLEEIPKLQDQGRLSEASQHIGAELEARVTKMNEIEKDNPEITDIIDEIRNEELKQNGDELEKLEQELLGE